MSAGCNFCVMTRVVKIVNYYKSSFSNNLFKVGNCRKEDYLSKKYQSSVLKRPLFRSFCDFRYCNFNCVFLAFSKIRLPVEAGLQSAVSPFVFKINENFFHHSKLHFHTFQLIPITQYAIFLQNVSFCRDETHINSTLDRENNWIDVIDFNLDSDVARKGLQNRKDLCMSSKLTWRQCCRSLPAVLNGHRQPKPGCDTEQSGEHSTGRLTHSLWPGIGMNRQRSLSVGKEKYHIQKTFVCHNRLYYRKSF